MELSIKLYREAYPDRHQVTICGDHQNRSCGLAGKLVDLGCTGCMFSAGKAGLNTVNPEAKIRIKSKVEEEVN